MRKIIFITILLFATFNIGIFIFLTTHGIKTNYFNNLINEKVNEVNSKLKLDLNDVNFKFNPANFKFEAVTKDPKIFINDKKIDLETINFDIQVIDYLNDKNPISQLNIKSKENNIEQVFDFINEYDFNLARKLVFEKIKKGKIKIFSEISFDNDNPGRFKYLVNGTVRDAEFKLANKYQADDIKFNFKINENLINLKEIELIFNKIFISSDDIDINKINNQFEISGNFKTKEAKININNYNLIKDNYLNILDDQSIKLSSDNILSFKINNKLKINDFKIESKLNFDQLFTKSTVQDLIYLKNGSVLINYSEKDLKFALESKFLFKNKKYNYKNSKNLFKLLYKKKQNSNASVSLNLTNTKNKINTTEFNKFLAFENINLPEQEIIFGSENEIKFNLTQKNKIKNLDIKSKINTENVIINYKSQRIKKYLGNFKNQIKLSQSDIYIENINNDFKLDLKSKYSLNNINEKIILNLAKKNNNYFFDLDLDLDSAEIQINELDYKKNANIKSNLKVNGNYKENNEILFNNIKFSEEDKELLVQNLEINTNDKIKKLDLFKIDLVNKIGKKNELEFKKINNNYYLTGSEFDGTKNIKNLLDNTSKSIFSYFKDLNTYIYVDIGKYFINNESYLSNLKGEILIKNNQLNKSSINAKLNNNRKFNLEIFTGNNKQKITNLEIEKPAPFIENFKFIKGFKEGNLIYESSEYDGKTISNLKIIDFKVKEVPVLAKLLTLASLQGIADLLTGEGIRFTDFEMDYETLGNTTNIKELYAIGPAISLMMDGYIVKDNLTSLKGTLVPATTVNKTIAKIPMLGEILVGKKIGEGIFGVSFKIKGPPKKLKTSVNPIKTLTPRFITRTLEKISN